MKRIILLLIILPVSLRLFAQTDSTRCFSFIFSNDVFNKTDRYFTQGLEFELMHPVFERSFVNKILINDGKANKKYYGLRLVHHVYTPSDYNTDVYDPNDHPYAGTLTLEEYLITNSNRLKRRITSAFLIGLMGPSALGKEVQNKFHEIIGNNPALGWDTQVGNAVLINYSASIEKGLVNNKSFEMMAKGTAEAGTLRTNAQAGMKFRSGLMRSYFEHHEDEEGGFQLFVQAEGMFKYSLYDATLSGPLFHDRDYGIPDSRIIHEVFQAELAAVLSYRSFRFSVIEQVVTPEFDNAYWNKWLSIRLGYQF